MNVPTLPGQQVQVQQAPAAYGQVAPVGAAPVLGAVAQISQQFGQDAAARAEKLKAQDKQAALLQGSVDARKAADERYVAFRGLSGDLAVKGGPLAVADYQKWAEDYAANLDPDIAKIFTAHADEIGLGLARDIDTRTYDIKEGMANAALTSAYNTGEQSAFGVGASGLVRLSQTPSLPATAGAAAPGASGTAGATILDERALTERVNTVRSAGKVWLEAHPGADAIEAETTKQAVARVYAAAIQGALEPGPHQDYRVAQKLYDVHAEELGDQREKMQALTSNATIAGSADDAEKAAFFMEAKNDGSTTDRLDAMLKHVDAMTPPPQAADKDKWYDRVRAGVREREQQYQRDAAVKRDNYHHELDADIMAGKFRDFAQVEQSAKYAALAKEPGLQRALVSTWKQYDSGEFTVTAPADYADAVDMANDPKRAHEFLDYNFAAHPQRFSREDIHTFESIQVAAKQQAAAGAEASKSGLYSNPQIANQKAKEFYPGSEKDEDVMTKRGTFLGEMDSLIKSYKRSHDGKEPDTDWFRKEIDALHAERVMQLPAEGGRGYTYTPLGVLQIPKTEEVTASLLDRVPAERLNQIISDLLDHDMEPTAEAIMARLADTQARTDGN